MQRPLMRPALLAVRLTARPPAGAMTTAGRMLTPHQCRFPKVHPLKRRPSEIEAALAQLDREHLRRERRTVNGFVEPGSRVTTIVDGRQLVDFSSNDYLGLARHPAVAAAMSECAERCGSGSGASHLVTGHGAEHSHLEDELAAFTGRER